MTEFGVNWCDRVDDYLGCALSPEDRGRFEEHLEECSACRRELAEWQTLSRVLRTATQELEAPGGTLASVGEVAAAGRAWTERPARSYRRAVAVAGVCGLLAAVLLTLPRSANEFDRRDHHSVRGLTVKSVTPSPRVEVSDDFIGVPVDIGDDSVTVVWLYPSVQPGRTSD